MSEPRPRLVFNALPLTASPDGVSSYIRGLLGAIGPEVDAELVAAVQPEGVGELPSGVIPLVKGASRGARRAAAGALGFGPAALVHGLDVDLPWTGRPLTVSTVHDLAVFDVPWAFPRQRAIGERMLVRHALRRADAVVAVSAFTAERVRVLVGREATVVHSAPAAELSPPGRTEVDRVRDCYRLPERFVLHVGNIEPRKDVGTLAEACRLASVPLVVTGRGLWGHRAPEGVSAVGQVPAADLPGLYGAATIVGYASRYEGFGLPPIEAMACGATVVSTPVPAVTEVAGDAVATFRPGDVEGLAATLRRLLADPDELAELGARGQERVRPLSWSKTGAAIAELYRSLGLRV